MTSIYLLKKDQEEEFLTLLKDMLKQIIMSDYDSEKSSTFIN